ncbi:SixA phosphatase family protein [Roseinatronobacter alkalisoli]|uniref:Histidine phosphatase family protein n=1 Tax=Roseinatronobacter alkalisoli TaxID=3028235 RepID=A0ABT5T922_9RHOB|nr:histidine phosphatase family protein [Roseinatronobacter sp. HJB301]MDD7971620.1 histidine phosphatase family protein [Roseinatronobacter sp. HJB301]
MTLRLILTRHAKSDWDNPLDSDHMRPLNPRGQRAAPKIGRWLARNGHLPQQALVSDAARTRQTWERLSAEFPAPVPARFEAALYHAGPDMMMQILQSASADTVIMIGHNPGIAVFARMLVDSPPTHPGFTRYPTCSTVIVEFDAPDWGSVRYGSGRVAAFIVPRDLDQAD